MSCVLRISNGRRTALLVGDIEEGAGSWRSLPAFRSLAADLLLVPHHGSKTSSSATFLDAVQPQWAMAQAGYRNRFGHPAADVVARYRGARHTPRAGHRPCGAARWRSPGARRVRCERIEAANVTGTMRPAVE
jgi:competence protein ComEC